jgi:hypothetical protein
MTFFEYVKYNEFLYRMMLRENGLSRRKYQKSKENYVMRSLLAIVRVIQSKSMRWARRMACMGKQKNAVLWWQNLKSRTTGRPMGRWG